MNKESPSRRLWRAVETIHAVTYFSAESIRAAQDAGFKGFWMGYFGFRSAPLGKVQPAVVEALFNNFSADRVNRALPDAWSFVTPEEALRARSRSAEQALQRLGVTPPNDDLLHVMQSAVMAIAPHGRGLFSANRALVPEGVALRDLWQWCTTVREHRGDSHVAALAILGINGLEATVLLAIEQGIKVEMFEESRGWHHDHLSGAVAETRLEFRILQVDGTPVWVETNGRAVTDPATGAASAVDVVMPEAIPDALPDASRCGER